MERKLEGKVAIITGAGSGMGRATAYLFAKNGAKLLICDINESAVNETKENILAEGGVAEAVVTDMGNPDDVAAMVKKAADIYGTIDILINNAGIYDDAKPATEITVDYWNKVFAINVTGPFVAAKEALPYMLEKHSGTIVNVCSVASIRSKSGGAAYTSSKHAALGLTRQLSIAYGQQGVKVNAICPGVVYSGLVPRDLVPEEFVKTFSNIPAGRLGEVEDIANAALFLCTEESAFIHGQPIVVDGGFSI